METALEYMLKNVYKADMIAYMNTHPECFEEAIKLAISDKQTCSHRSASLLWSCMEENDERLQVYVKSIIDSIKTKNDGQQRELLKVLLKMKLNEEYEGFLFDFCVNVWTNVRKAPSVRFTAFKVIVKMATIYPDLANEISLLTQNEYMESLSPAVNKSITKMIKGFNLNK